MQKLLHAIIKTGIFLLQELRKRCIFTQSVATLNQAGQPFSI